MPAHNGTPDPSHVAVAAGLGEQTPILASILAELRSGVLQIGAADVRARELVLDQFPVPGSKRVLPYRTGNGSDGLAIGTTGLTLVIAANEGRLGGMIVNAGANAVILYLTERNAPAEGIPAIWLAASGGSWDFRLGNVLWCGNVSAIAITAASSLTVAEV